MDRVFFCIPYLVSQVIEIQLLPVESEARVFLVKYTQKARMMSPNSKDSTLIKTGLSQQSLPESAIDRKTFLRTAGSAALFAAMGIGLTGCGVSDSNDDSSDLEIDGNTVRLNLASSDYAMLNNQNGWIRIGGRAGLLLVNVDGTLIRAFSQVCPHQGCSDAWAYSNQRFTCQCHNSVFENTGARVSGPATADLTEYSVSRSGDMLTVTK